MIRVGPHPPRFLHKIPFKPGIIGAIPVPAKPVERVEPVESV